MEAGSLSCKFDSKINNFVVSYRVFLLSSNDVISNLYPKNLLPRELTMQT